MITDEMIDHMACIAFKYHVGEDADLHEQDDKLIDGPYLVELWSGWMRAGLSAVYPLVAKEIINDIANSWQRGQWANAPRCKDRIVERVANANFVAEWLRSQADKYEKKVM